MLEEVIDVVDTQVLESPVLTGSTDKALNSQNHERVYSYT